MFYISSDDCESVFEIRIIDEFGGELRKSSIVKLIDSESDYLQIASNWLRPIKGILFVAVHSPLDFNGDEMFWLPLSDTCINDAYQLTIKVELIN